MKRQSVTDKDRSPKEPPLSTEEQARRQDMSAIKTILRILTLTFLLFALLAAPLFPSHAATRDRKTKTQARTSQAKNRHGASERDLRSKGNKRTLTGRARPTELRRLEARREKIARRHTAAAESSSTDSLRDRVQSMISMDETAGEDPEVRRVAVKALGNHAGTVVVMDPNTGRIFSVVNQQWALREGFKPCSTIKLVTGLAGLNEGLIDPAAPTKISTGSGRNLTSALAHSNNEYFQEVGGRVGFEKFLFYARQLGLGEKTGINARNESAGRVPEYKSGFALNHMSSHGDDFQVTAVQLATLVSAMTNGGRLLTPFIPRVPQDEMRIKPRVRRQIKIDTEVWSRMVPGMIGAVNYGSGRKAYNPSEMIAGKTGTCIQEGSWVGLFASYAPLNNPKLAVVVIGLGPDGRGHFPAAVAGEIYRNLNYRFGTSVNEQIAKFKAPAYQAAPTVVVNRDGQAARGVESPRVAGLNINRESGSLVQKSIWINSAPKGSNTVKSVLLSVPKRTQVGNSSTNSKSEQQSTRPRRVSVDSNTGAN